MKLTEEDFTNLIRQISNKLTELVSLCKAKDQLIDKLKQENETLRKDNTTIYNQVKEYIKELEQIKNYYADSNNKLN